MWAYCDMDAFFASVAQRHLSEKEKQKPMAVSSGMHGYSEICSANYAARAHGVKANFVLMLAYLNANFVPMLAYI